MYYFHLFLCDTTTYEAIHELAMNQHFCCKHKERDTKENKGESMMGAFPEDTVGWKQHLTLKIEPIKL